MNTFIDFCFSQPGLVLIPAEQLSATGLNEAFRQQLADHPDFDQDWIKLFEACLQAYWERLSELHSQLPSTWFPPRLQNIAIVTDTTLVRPYFQPFFESAWLLYRSDFDPSQSNLEFGVFQMLQVERMGLLKQVVSATGANLGYWLLRSDAEVEAFGWACEKNSRRDIHTYKALRKALPWLRQQYHKVFRPLTSDQQCSVSDVVEIPGTDLLVRKRSLPDLERLIQSCTKSASNAVAGFFKTFEKPDVKAADDLCDWLISESPRLLITGENGQLLWDFEQAVRVDQLRPLLKLAHKDVLRSLRMDWEVIGRKTTDFLNRLVDPDALPPPQAHYADQNGLSYMHIKRREVAYNIQEQGMQRLREITPPYERWMLAARTIHEWGHIFVDQGWVPVAENRADEYQQLLARCAGLYEDLYSGLLAAHRREAKASFTNLQQEQESIGQALTRLTLARMEDFQANLMAQRFLTTEEMETYVRNNHRSHVHDYDRQAFFQRLARYAYEYQYLRFSFMPDAYDYFIKTTWFAEQYLHPGIVTEEKVKDLFGIVASICDCYQVDETRFVAA